MPGWGRVKYLITPDHSPCSSYVCQAEAESSAWSPLTTRVCAKLRKIQVLDHPWPHMSVPSWGKVKYLIIPDYSCLCQAEAESSTWSPLPTHVCAKLRQSQVPDHPWPLVSVPSWGRVKYLIAPAHSCLCQAEAQSSTWLPRTTVLVLRICARQRQSSTWSPLTTAVVLHVCARLRQSQVPDRPWPFVSVPSWGTVKCPLIPGQSKFFTFVLAPSIASDSW